MMIDTEARLELANHRRYCEKAGRYRPGCRICEGDPSVRVTTTVLKVISRTPVTYDGDTESFSASGICAVISKSSVNVPRGTGL